MRKVKYIIQRLCVVAGLVGSFLCCNEVIEPTMFFMPFLLAVGGVMWIIEEESKLK